MNEVTQNNCWEGKNIHWEAVGQIAVVSLAFIVPISTALTTALVGIILLSWFLGKNFEQKKRILLYHPLVRWIYPLVFVTLIGMTYSIGDNEAIKRGVIDGLRLSLIPILIYYYRFNRIAKYALIAFCSAMIVTLILAYLKVYAGFPIGLKYTMGGIFKSHIKTSYFMAIAAFLISFQIKKQKQYRLMLIFVVISMIYYLFFMNVGRIGYLTLSLCMLVIAWQFYRYKGLGLSLVLVITMILGAYFLSPVFQERVNIIAKDLDFYHQGKLHENSVGSRLHFAKQSGLLMIQKPILGWGTGSFGNAYANNIADKNGVVTDNPHNEYLRIGVEYGLLGLCLLIALFYQLWHLSKRLPSNICILFRGIFFTFIVGCFLNSWLRDFTESYFFCLMSAICFSFLPLAPSPRESKVLLN